MKRNGFTLVEILVVAGIIGLLASVSMLILSGARARSRDAKRVSDIQIIRAALEQHWLEKASYPSSSFFVNMGTGAAAQLTTNGLESVTGTGAIYLTLPVGPNANEYYQYQSTLFNGYALRFTTEQATTYGPAGTYYAHGVGVDTDSSSK